jgi:hypothetical protein
MTVFLLPQNPAKGFPLFCAEFSTAPLGGQFSSPFRHFTSRVSYIASYFPYMVSDEVPEKILSFFCGRVTNAHSETGCG